MKSILFSLIISLTFSNLIAQNISLPKNPKAGKCYKRCFYYDKPIVKWEEVDCNNLKDTKPNRITANTLKTKAEVKNKFIAYQKKLIALNYKLEATGVLDEKTINAHYKYVQFKKKQARKAKRKNRKNRKNK